MGIALCLIQIAVTIHSVRRIFHASSVWRQPFNVENYKPVVGYTFGDDDENEDQNAVRPGDRILRINGKPVLNRWDLIRGLREGRNQGSVNLLVQHAGSAERNVFVKYEHVLDVNPAMTTLPAISLGGLVVWPLICSLLAALLLWRNGLSPTAWMAAGALTGGAQISWMAVDPFSFFGPLTIPAIIFQTCAPVVAAFCGYSLAIQLPRPLFDQVVARHVVFAIAVLLAVAGILRAWLELGSLFRYEFVEFAPAIGQAAAYSKMVILGSAVAMAVRAIHGWGGMPKNQARIQCILFVGTVLAFAGILGTIFLFSRSLRFDGAPWWQTSLHWLAGGLTLGWPVAIFLVGMRRENERLEENATPVALSEIEAW